MGNYQNFDNFLAFTANEPNQWGDSISFVFEYT